MPAKQEAGAADRRGRSEVVRDALQLWLQRRALAAKVRQHREGGLRHPVTPDVREALLFAPGFA
jgi:Arc/MetJ-type ribon-helix-helix transcriptional regulator